MGQGGGGGLGGDTDLQTLLLCFGGLTHAAKSVLNGLAHAHARCYVITP